MSIHRAWSWLLTGALLIGGSRTALAQHVYGEEPIPFDVKDYHDFQPFAPAPLSEYGNGPAPNEGWFLTYDRIIMGATPPEKVDIGSEAVEDDIFFDAETGTLFTEQNSLDNGFLNATSGWANRYEFGYIVEDCGWMATIFGDLKQGQFNNITNAQILFNDPDGRISGFFDGPDADTLDDDSDGDGIFGNDGQDLNGDGDITDAGESNTDLGFQVDLDDLFISLPTFGTVNITNSLEVRGFELMRMYRFPPMHNRGVMEVYVGARYLEIDETFDLTALGGFFPTSVFQVNHKVDNQIVGPQIGLRYSHRRGRWTMNTEGRLTAGVNFRGIHQEGTVPIEDSIDPTNVNIQRSFKNSFVDEEFAAVGELRIEGVYQLTKAIAIKAGYVGILSGGVARASNTVDYTLPNLGITNPGHGEDIMLNGASFGLEINR